MTEQAEVRLRDRARQVVPLMVFMVAVTALLALGLTPKVAGIRTEFVLFAMIIGGIALFHDRSFALTLSGLIGIIMYKYGATIPDEGAFSLVSHLGHEWRTIVNLFLLLLGFALLAKLFEESNVVAKLVAVLPNGWAGCFLLLGLVWFISSFLDNIAAALIGGTIALIVFKKEVHVGYIAGIVAASNAGGAWSVLGDTTTTLMWIAGVHPLNVAHGILGSVIAYLIFGSIAAWQQNNHHALRRDALNLPGTVDYGKIAIVFLVLVGAIIANFKYDFFALGVWAGLLLGATFRKLPWGELKTALMGSVFLVMLVTCASMMPVKELPDPSAQTAFILGCVSAVFDNIPLTALAIKQGCYDWGMLAFTVGFGGSMIWFGSSAGVAITTLFPHARAVGPWLRRGWHVALAYVIAFAVLFLTLGWNPEMIGAAPAPDPAHMSPPAIVAPPAAAMPLAVPLP
ncbi:MAG TPA: citrate transporter [bacterium]|mgnify:CR=1 FL=1|nr:citrate transporter [bacterium]